MNKSTSQQASPSLVQPTDPVVTLSVVCPRYAVINANIGRGRDWVASVGFHKRFGFVQGPPEYWQYYAIKGSARSKTIILDAWCFYRARLSGHHFGLYIDLDGQIKFLQEKAFTRELDRRFRDGVAHVDFTCDGDWANDRFSLSIPEANLGEAEFVLLSPQP